MHTTYLKTACSLAALAAPLLAHGAPQVTSVAGPDAASITAAVAAFRTTIAEGGANNGGAAGPFGSGFRNINWDGAPDTVSAPNLMPGTFFNSNAPRGIVFSTPGTGLLMSADDSNPTSTPVRFGNINPAYSTQFQTFSAQRLFAADGSTIVDCDFFVPSSPSTPATVNGMCVVFCDVDEANRSLLEFFDVDGISLGSWRPAVADGGLSFLGVYFDEGERVARVRITHGNLALGASNNDASGQDVVVLDDFMYSEPLPFEPNAKLVNISTRGFVNTGDGVLIGGFVVTGNEPKTFLVRAVGPSLSEFLGGWLADPILEILDVNGAVIASNDNWGNSLLVENTSVAVGASPLALGSADAALVVVLAPGAYTARVSGVGGTTGIALVEVYEF
jgi:hypothetical protein